MGSVGRRRKELVMHAISNSAARTPAPGLRLGLLLTVLWTGQPAQAQSQATGSNGVFVSVQSGLFIDPATSLGFYDLRVTNAEGVDTFTTS